MKKSLNLIIWTALLVLPFILQVTNIISTSSFAIHKDNGLLSIITGSFLHGNVGHLTGNMIPLLGCIAVITTFYKNIYYIIIPLGILLPSSYMYFIAGSSTIGISGLCYATTWFVILRGLGSQHSGKLVCSIIFLLLYGSSWQGVLPNPFSNIAWQSHFVGMVIGVSIAVLDILFSDVKQPENITS